MFDLIDKYKFLKYLEIGVFQGENIRLVKAAHKDGVDPGAEGYVIPEVTYPMTSDDFFNLLKGHNEIKNVQINIAKDFVFGHGNKRVYY